MQQTSRIATGENLEYVESVRSARTWLQLAFAVLSLIVALGGTLPAYARMAAGPKAHVCHCDTAGAHAHCECPICFPDLDTSLEARILSISGKCGDDDTGWKTLSEPGVMPSPVITLVPAVRIVDQHAHNRDLESQWHRPIEPPPPRSVV